MEKISSPPVALEKVCHEYGIPVLLAPWLLGFLAPYLTLTTLLPPMDASRSGFFAKMEEGSYFYSMQNTLELPAGLPVPEDDGACNHLYGTRIPELWLPSTDGKPINLAQTRGRTVLFCYPRTGQPDQPVPAGWDAIPGARGCTPQCRAFRDHYRELLAAGASHIFGLSTQDTDYQREAVERLELPYPLLSDRELDLAHALKLPTFQFDSMTLIKRLTLIVDNGWIAKVFYPVFPTDKSAEQTLEWLVQNQPTS